MTDPTFLSDMVEIKIHGVSPVGLPVSAQLQEPRFVHLGRLPRTVEQDGPLDPPRTGILRAQAVVPHQNRAARRPHEWGAALSMGHVTNPPGRVYTVCNNGIPTGPPWARSIISSEPGTRRPTREQRLPAPCAFPLALLRGGRLVSGRMEERR